MIIDKMKTTWRERVQYTTAVLAFLSGLVLTWVLYVQQGEISNGVLGFVAQTLVYSASIYGVSIYIQGKFGEIKSYIALKENEIDRDYSIRKESHEDSV